MQYVPEKNIKTRFSDVIGLGESTEELKLMVEYLKVLIFELFFDFIESTKILFYWSQVPAGSSIHWSTWYR